MGPESGCWEWEWGIKGGFPFSDGKSCGKWAFPFQYSSLHPKTEILVLKKAVIPPAHATEGTSQPLCPGNKDIITDGKQVQGWDFIAEKIIYCNKSRMLLSWDLSSMTWGADGLIWGGTGSWGVKAAQCSHPHHLCYLLLHF